LLFVISDTNGKLPLQAMKTPLARKWTCRCMVISSCCERNGKSPPFLISACKFRPNVRSKVWVVEVEVGKYLLGARVAAADLVLEVCGEAGIFVALLTKIQYSDRTSQIRGVETGFLYVRRRA
jgi:hypothetical protein